MRAALDTLYRVATGLAAACLVAIALLVVAQVGGRLIDGARSVFGLEPLGLLVPSLAEIAGFLLVGASFLALPGTLRRGDHIRVSIFLQIAPSGLARFLDLWSLAVAFGGSAFFTWHAAMLARDSYIYNEVSFGILPIPLVFPQLVLTAGLGVFTIALLDDLIAAVSGSGPSFNPVEKTNDPIEGTE
ncbi:TRAP-type C4-dicarboxylate transport system permease small subunit [Roseibium hamelinense]|uniref:TRAP transporter small permease protein n=1 Tax=Roseibium hamelinense TaxID=150831 RepID=A0A562T9E9_9HYPH|nr:TRAP transporter small permease [Roseibium hamelinense]MTI45456.1 TRAP transporter small permease [Roseibium hamelinense]TWI90172.1 TRAP-type C4-dicarboxylate transport system permease small subunit [Roseibium hamelinense]